MSKVVKIACRIPNGISLRLFKPGYDDGTGFRPMTHDGPAVFLAGPSALHTGVGNTDPQHTDPVFSDIDAEWWEAWLAQNQQNPMVTMEQVYRVKEDDPAENPTE